MNSSLSTVLVDDNPDDRALVIRELRREFPNLSALEVTDNSGLDRVLAASPSDLVVTDYQLRWTNGLAVLQAVKSKWPDCPVIMFTGTGNEEVAVEAMKAGLDDYLMKSPKHYARLPGIARLALKMADQRRQLKEAEVRRREADEERERLILELQDALATVKTLSGLLPICAGCKKIRDDHGHWNPIELFIQSHSDAEFTHSFCPDCLQRLYPEVFDRGTRANP
jgi:DNA-binding NtrC family response regulator